MSKRARATGSAVHAFCVFVVLVTQYATADLQDGWRAVSIAVCMVSAAIVGYAVSLAIKEWEGKDVTSYRKV